MDDPLDLLCSTFTLGSVGFTRDHGNKKERKAKRGKPSVHCCTYGVQKQFNVVDMGIGGELRDQEDDVSQGFRDRGFPSSITIPKRSTQTRSVRVISASLLFFFWGSWVMGKSNFPSGGGEDGSSNQRFVPDSLLPPLSRQHGRPWQVARIGSTC